MLRSLLNTLTGRRPDPTEGWPQISLSAPDIDSSQGGIGPLRFGDELATAHLFGRPDIFRWIQPDYCEMVYTRAGFQIDFDKGRMAYAAFFLGPDSHLLAGASFSAPRLDSSSRLSRDIQLKQIETVFGHPKSRDTDAEEIILFYEKNGLTIEFEATATGELKRLNVYPTTDPNPTSSALTFGKT